MTLKEAREIQKQRESKAVFQFLAAVAFIGVGSFLLFYLTDVLTISTAFYLIPIALFGFAVKKTKIYKFFEPKEFVGKIVRMDVYPVKVGKIRGDDTYEQNWGEALEVEMIIDNGNKTKMVAVLASKSTWYLAEGKKVAVLRFIYYPIIVEE